MTPPLDPFTKDTGKYPIAEARASATEALQQLLSKYGDLPEWERREAFDEAYHDYLRRHPDAGKKVSVSRPEPAAAPASNPVSSAPKVSTRGPRAAAAPKPTGPVGVDGIPLKAGMQVYWYGASTGVLRTGFFASVDPKDSSKVFVDKQGGRRVTVDISRVYGSDPQTTAPPAKTKPLQSKTSVRLGDGASIGPGSTVWFPEGGSYTRGTWTGKVKPNGAIEIAVTRSFGQAGAYEDPKNCLSNFAPPPAKVQVKPAKPSAATGGEPTAADKAAGGNMVARFKSSSNPNKVYEVLQYPSGALSCSCPAWTFKKEGQDRSCKHTKVVRMGGKGDAANVSVLGLIGAGIAVAGAAYGVQYLTKRGILPGVKRP